jgi:dCTP diphosphatase
MNVRGDMSDRASARAKVRRSADLGTLPRADPPRVHLCYVARMDDPSVRDELAAFVAERDWAQFHSLENLAKSIAIEAGELLECFQWTTDADPARVRDELADVLTYSLLLADALGSDPESLVRDKLAVSRAKYPTATARGRSTKYDGL